MLHYILMILSTAWFIKKQLSIHKSSILTKALRTDRPTNRLTDMTSYRDADASKNYGSFVNSFEFVSDLDQTTL